MQEQQLVLPFGHRFAEDRASLVRAIRAAGLRPGDETFLLYVHDVSRDGELRRTYHEIADRINCSRRTAIRLVQRCIDSGILHAVVDRYRSGGQRENAYSIDWDGVRFWSANGSQTPTRSEGQGVTRGCQSVTGECHRVTGECQTGTPYKEIDPPSDPPSDPPPPSEARGGGGSDWSGLRERLQALGMADAPGAIQAARGAGLSVQDAAQLIDQWEAARPAWDLGGLYWRLTRGTWPERAAEVVRQERRAEDQRQRERQRAELLRERREAEAEAARRRELEDRLGGMLDSLPADELEQLARLVYCDEWRWSYYARNRASPLVREDLLQELERSLEAMA